MKVVVNRGQPQQQQNPNQSTTHSEVLAEEETRPFFSHSYYLLQHLESHVLSLVFNQNLQDTRTSRQTNNKTKLRYQLPRCYNYQTWNLK